MYMAKRRAAAAPVESSNHTSQESPGVMSRDDGVLTLEMNNVVKSLHGGHEGFTDLELIQKVATVESKKLASSRTCIQSNPQCHAVAHE